MSRDDCGTTIEALWIKTEEVLRFSYLTVTKVGDYTPFNKSSSSLAVSRRSGVDHDLHGPRHSRRSRRPESSWGKPEVTPPTSLGGCEDRVVGSRGSVVCVCGGLVTLRGLPPEVHGRGPPPGPHPPSGSSSIFRVPGPRRTPVPVWTFGRDGKVTPKLESYFCRTSGGVPPGPCSPGRDYHGLNWSRSPRVS